MEPGKHSVTAEFVGAARTLHQLVDRPPVIDDPVAIHLLRPAVRERLTAITRGPLPAGNGEFRAWIAARSRYSDEALATAVGERGVTQCVILGAGLDTFAYRNPIARPIRVFEVDFPASQSLKRERLREGGIAEPPSLTFVALDLRARSLLDALIAAGARTNAPAFFSALGLIPYLSAETIGDLLRMIAVAFPPGSEIVFDYTPPKDHLPPALRGARGIWGDRAARAGEPFLTLVTPTEVRRMLLRAGFRHIEHLDSEAINGRYFFAREDGLNVGPGWAGLARAAV